MGGRLVLVVVACASALLQQPRVERWRGQRRRLKAEADEECEVAEQWATGEFTARCAPLEPSAELPPEAVVANLCRGLQFVDVPRKNAGLERCYNFMTLPCRVAVSGQGRQLENRGLDKFIDRGFLSPQLQPFIGCSSLEFGEMSRIDGTATRGALASVSVRVRASPLTATRHPSGLPKDDRDLPEFVFAIRLQRERRPPMTGQWYVTDLIDTEMIGSNRDLRS